MNDTITLQEIMNDLEKRGIVISQAKRFNASIERGHALNKIHKNKLYKQKYHSFNSCVETEFGCTAQQARNLMIASDVYDNLKNHFENLPHNSKELIEVYNASRRRNISMHEAWQEKQKELGWISK